MASPQALQLAQRIRFAQQHPVIGLAALASDTALTKTPGIARRLVQTLETSRPDLAEEVRRRLQPVDRACPHCGNMTPKELDRCRGAENLCRALKRWRRLYLKVW